MSRIMVKRMAFGMTAAFIVGVVSQFAVAQAPSLDARSIRIAALGANEVSKAAITHRSEKKRRRPWNAACQRQAANRGLTARMVSDVQLVPGEQGILLKRQTTSGGRKNAGDIAPARCTCWFDQ
ncbi:MAG: hypothetical protein ACXWJW_07095 [Xanthobacteraceae bacterium]